MFIQNLPSHYWGLFMILSFVVLVHLKEQRGEESYRIKSFLSYLKGDRIAATKIKSHRAVVSDLKIRVYKRHGNFDKENNKRIFFHEASGNEFLNVRQTCAVESAAIHNPNRQIQLFMHTMKHPNPCSQWYEVLANYTNVEVILVDDTKYFADTPFHDWYFGGTSDILTNSKKEHFADYAKMLTLIKGGGMSLDLDYVVLKSFPERLFSNFLAFEDDITKIVSYSAFHFDFGHKMIERLTTMMKKDYKNDILLSETYGSGAATSALIETCGLTRKQRRINCPDLKVFRHSVFTPIGFDDLYSIFNYNIDSDGIIASLNKSYALYNWNTYSHNLPVTFDMKQTYSELAKVHCPKTVSVASKFA